jgi:hypothetical protein
LGKGCPFWTHFFVAWSFRIVDVMCFDERGSCILGGLDVNILSKGTTDDVRKRVREILDVCGHDGGYCMGSGNSVTNYCKIENYLAMIDETRKWNEERGYL